MDINQVIHDLTMRYIGDADDNTEARVFAELYVRIYRKIEERFKELDFDTIGDAPEWK